MVKLENSKDVIYRAFGLDSSKPKDWLAEIAWMIRQLEHPPDLIRTGIPGIEELLPDEFRTLPRETIPAMARECWFGFLTETSGNR